MAKVSISYMLLVLSNIFLLTFAAPQKRANTSLAETLTLPPPPSKDPFYTAPDGYQNAAPGAILRVRSAPGLAAVAGNSSAAYNILYRTTDGNYQPAWAVTTLYVPETSSTNSVTNGTNATSGSILLSWQDAYDSPNVDFSPSYTSYNKSTIDPVFSGFLGQGWYLNVPDYEGPLASYGDGVQSGHATIDSVRAALNSGFGLDSNNTKYALFGYSGGALASEWAAELQVQYAPEMNFAGMAIGGLVPNATNGALAVNGTPDADTVVQAILGLTSQHPTVRQYIVSQLKTSGPYNATGFLAALTQSPAEDAGIYANQDIFNYFVSGSDVLQDPQLTALIDRNDVWGYHGVPSMPVFAYKAIGDEFSPIADSDALIEKYCADGANILYNRNTVGGHLAEYFNGEPRAIDFLNAVLDGTYSQKYQDVGCTIQTVTIAIDSSPQ